MSPCLKVLTGIVRRLAATRMAHNYRTIVPFHPPEWARDLPAKVIPKSKVSLAMLPTPIHEWSRFPGLPEGFSLGIKRDDMNHCTISGNKIRKLEFLLADALQNGCDSIITAGSLQTNHGRATAVAARELGMDTYLVLRTKPSALAQKDNLPCVGNVFLDRMVGSGIVLAPKVSAKALSSRLEKLTADLAEDGKKTYSIPIGGSNDLGLWGYISAFQELLEQGLAENFDDIVHACGSGGTACGLAVGNYLAGSPVKIHSVCVCDGEEYFYNHIDDTLKSIQLDGKVSARDIVDVVEDYRGGGYAVHVDEADELVLSVARHTGIVLESVYTGKAVYGMVDMMRNQPGRFKGRRVLFLHTGGIFGAYDGDMSKLLQEKHQGDVVAWVDDMGEVPRPRE